MEDGSFAWEFLKILAGKNWNCLVIGRQAMSLYGAPIATQDVDVIVATESDEKLLRKLAEDFGLDMVHEEQTRGIFSCRKRLITYGDTLGPSNPIHYRKLDILVCPRIKSFRFDKAFTRSTKIEIEPGLFVSVPHLDDLVILKKAANRPRDREDVAWLTEHRDEILHQDFRLPAST